MRIRLLRKAARLRAAGLTRRRIAVALIAGKVIKVVIGLAVLLTATGCVHEWPDPASGRTVTLHVSHATGWTLADYLIDVRSGRAAAQTRAQSEAVRYLYRVYPAGTTEVCVAEMTRWSTDLTLAPFSEELDLPAGDWDIYIWSDYAAQPGGASLFYDTESFRAITYGSPYRGSTVRKDAFRGVVSVSVPESIDAEVSVDAYVELQRPLTSYAFVATDLREFIVLESTRRETSAKDGDDATKGPGEGTADVPSRLPDYEGYTVTVVYPGFLPSVFNNFTDKPVDSSTGISYTSSISELSDDEALLAFDYFFVNGHDSSVTVGVEVADREGNVIARTGAFEIPVVRGRCTVVRGEFLTSKATGGVGISPGFNGDFNIEIK